MKDAKAVKSRRISCIVYLISSFLYLIVFIFSLECLGLFSQLWIERNNPLISAYKNQQPLTVETLSISLCNAETYYPLFIGGWDMDPNFFNDDPSMKQVLDSGPRNIHATDEEQQHRRDTFPLLSSAARDAYALLNGEIVLKMDSTYHIQEVYGSAKDLFAGPKRFIRRFLLKNTSKMKLFREAIDKTVQSGLSQSVRVTSSAEDLLRAVCIADKKDAKGTRGVFVFIEAHPELSVEYNIEKDSNDSRWAVNGFRYKSNYRNADGSFCTNKLGFRGDEVEIPKPIGLFRILCVGGSTTDEGPTNDETYPYLLEKYLKQVMPDFPVEVINAGLPGASSFVHLLRFPDYLALQPDLIVIHAGINDLQRQYLQARINLLPRISRFIKMYLPSLCAPSLEKFCRRHQENMGFSLELFITLAQRHNIAVALASIAYPDPELIDKNARQYFDYQATYAWAQPGFSLPTYTKYIRASNHLLREISEAHNTLYIPVAERIRGGINVFWDFCHMTPAGIEAKAAVICDSILPMLEEVSQETAEKQFSLSSP